MGWSTTTARWEEDITLHFVKISSIRNGTNSTIVELVRYLEEILLVVTPMFYFLEEEIDYIIF